ncbi:MAG: ATP-dependent Clp protease ATP-binding subunit ClpX [Proteobacteria bacterium]|nr:ATP-dependent Clp protease ATP-binding subunit ClpX [Pseudomonadota bacterium]
MSRTTKKSLHCSFCHKTQQDNERLKIIAGPAGVFICSDCVRLCLDIIKDAGQQKKLQWGDNSVPPPTRIKEYLDQHVVGQDSAKRKISVAVYNHYKRLEILQSQKENTSTGKSKRKTNRSPKFDLPTKRSAAHEHSKSTETHNENQQEKNDKSLLEIEEILSSSAIEQVGAELDGSKILAIPKDLSSVEVRKSNVLLIGPTGTGKTLIAQTLAKLMNVPFVVADATTLTEAGYVGEDVENIVAKLYRSANNNIDQTQRGIIFIDEIDKLAKKNSASSSSRDVSGEGVQQALLKIIEGTKASIQVKGKSKLGTQENVIIDTSNILFICGGAFEGLSKLIEKRTGARSLGFSVSEDPKEANSNDDSRLMSKATPEDLDKFGLIPEFIGRLPIIAVMNNLSEDDLIQVLKEPKNSLVKQYQKLFRLEKVTLSFTDDALKAIAQKAVERKAGARGLRTIIESIMLDIMYEMPSLPELKEVIVEEATVTEGSPPKTSFNRDRGVSS